MIHSHDITCHQRTLKFRPSTIKQIPYRFPTDGLCCSSQKQGSSFMSFLTKTTTEHEGKRGMK